MLFKALGWRLGYSPAEKRTQVDDVCGVGLDTGFGVPCSGVEGG